MTHLCCHLPTNYRIRFSIPERYIVKKYRLNRKVLNGGFFPCGNSSDKSRDFENNLQTGTLSSRQTGLQSSEVQTDIVTLSQSMPNLARFFCDFRRNIFVRPKSKLASDLNIIFYSMDEKVKHSVSFNTRIHIKVYRPCAKPTDISKSRKTTKLKTEITVKPILVDQINRAKTVLDKTQKAKQLSFDNDTYRKCFNNSKDAVFPLSLLARDSIRQKFYRSMESLAGFQVSIGNELESDLPIANFNLSQSLPDLQEELRRISTTRQRRFLGIF